VLIPLPWQLEQGRMDAFVLDCRPWPLQTGHLMEPFPLHSGHGIVAVASAM